MEIKDCQKTVKNNELGSLLMLNLNWSSDLKDGQFVGHIWNFLSAIPFSQINISWSELHLLGINMYLVVKGRSSGVVMLYIRRRRKSTKVFGYRSLGELFL